MKNLIACILAVITSVVCMYLFADTLGAFITAILGIVTYQATKKLELYFINIEV